MTLARAFRMLESDSSTDVRNRRRVVAEYELPCLENLRPWA